MDWYNAVNEEVKRLLENGMIWEVQYLEWLANLMVVPKNNGKMSVCIDFIDLKEVTPER